MSDDPTLERKSGREGRIFKLINGLWTINVSIHNKLKISASATPGSFYKKKC